MNEIDLNNSIYEYWVTSNIQGDRWIFSPCVCGNPMAQNYRYFGYCFGVSLMGMASNDSASTPELPVRPGYTFGGFYEDEAYTVPYDSKKLPTKEVYLYAKWTANPLYNVTYSVDGNAPAPKPQKVRGSDYLILPHYFGKKEKYEFAGWSDGIVNPLTGSVPIRKPDSMYIMKNNKDIVFTNVWEPVTYSLKFDKNSNEATGMMLNQKVKYGVAQKIRKNTFSRPGYLFYGWNTKSDGTGTYYADNAEYVASDNATLYALWVQDTPNPTNPIIPPSYSVTYSLGEGVVGVPPTQAPVSSGSFISVKPLPPDVVNNGKMFIGWLDSATNRRHSPGSVLKVESDIVFTAVWVTENTTPTETPTTPGPTYPPVKRSVTYELGEGVSGTPPIQPDVSEGTTLVVRHLPENISNPGKVFSGWLEVNSNTVYKPLSFLLVKNHDIVLRAIWKNIGEEPVFYTVTYMSDINGNIIKTESVESGHSPSFSAISFKSMFLNRGWLYNGNLVGNDFTVTNDITLYPNWVPLPSLLGNDEASLADVLSLLKYIGGTGVLSEKTQSEMIQMGADLNNDGEINLSDVLIYLKSI